MATDKNPTPDPSADVGALLVEVLRNVNREVEKTLELSVEAMSRVTTFRKIAADLATAPPAGIDAGNTAPASPPSTAV